jgi:hypothetical protein
MAPTDENYSGPPEAAQPGRVGELLHRITDDVKAISKEEVELARVEVTRSLKKIAIDLTVLILSGIIALMGVGFLCVAAVDALAPAIEPLWARLIIMGLVYLAVCAALVSYYAKRLKAKIPPDVPRTKAEAKRTVETVKEELRHA